MHIVWGTALYGKTDEVPQLCHVATRFGHVYHVPLVPLESYAVFSQDETGICGMALPLSYKSIFVAWLRTGIVFAAAAAFFLSAIQFVQHRPAWGMGLMLLCAAGVCLHYATYHISWLTRATYERARQIATHCDFNPMSLLMIEVAYGRLTAHQADVQLQRWQAEAAAAEAEMPQV